VTLKGLFQWGVLGWIAWTFSGELCVALMLAWLVVCHFIQKQDAIHEELVRSREVEEKALEPRRVPDRNDLYDGFHFYYPGELERERQEETEAERNLDLTRSSSLADVARVHAQICKIPGCKGAHRFHV